MARDEVVRTWKRMVRIRWGVYILGKKMSFSKVSGIEGSNFTLLLASENRAGATRYLKAIIYGRTGGPNKIAWLFVARPNRNNRSLTHILRCVVHAGQSDRRAAV